MLSSPTWQFSEISAALGNFTNATTPFLQNYWTSILGSSPLLYAPVATNKTAIAAILKGGAFAAPVTIPYYKNESSDFVCAAVYSVGVNAMWNADGVFIVKISDATLGQGPGAACNGTAQKGLVANNCGADGEAYIFIRWNFRQFGQPAKRGPWPHPLGPYFLDPYHWQVWGAYSSAPNNPAGNADELAQYGLDLNTIALSSVRTQEKLGFWGQDTLGIIQSGVETDLEGVLESSRLQVWNIAVCDLDAFAAGRHLDPSLGVSHHLGC